MLTLHHQEMTDKALLEIEDELFISSICAKASHLQGQYSFALATSYPHLQEYQNILHLELDILGIPFLSTLIHFIKENY